MKSILSWIIVSTVWRDASEIFANAGEVRNESAAAVHREERVVGGMEAKRGRYPYQVALVDSSGIQYCGGTLIAPRLVLSAAHCFGYGFQVHIGRHDLTNPSESFERIFVDYEMQHPQYDFATNDYDFMLVHLQTDSSYRTVTLDDGSLTVPVNLDVTVMGWGATCQNGLPSNILLEADVDIVTNEKCSMAYGLDPYGDTKVTDQMRCAWRAGRDSCQGDSGGPLIIKGSNPASDVQVGVISWGYSCADPDYPGVYARISSAYDWIDYVRSRGMRITSNDKIQYHVKSFIKRASINWKKKAKTTAISRTQLLRGGE